MTAAQTTAISRKALWLGRVVNALALLFLLIDAAVKVLKLAPAVEATAQLGYPEGTIVGIGIVELACLAAVMIPRTSILGAILLTGYLGGAVATHVRIGNPLFTHTLFPVYVAVLVWGGLYLRDDRVRALIPFRRPGTTSTVAEPDPRNEGMSLASPTGVVGLQGRAAAQL
jgi:hypothetical protein